MDKLVKSAVVGGVIFFIWSSISWMVLPFHAKTLKMFSNEAAIVQTMSANATGSGVYLLPKMSKDAPAAKSPFVFLVYNQDGYGNMGMRMFLGLLEDILTALVLAWLLSKSGISSFGARVGFISGMALFAGLAAHLTNLVWWGHSLGFTIVVMADLLVGWTLAGFAIAKLSS